MRSLFMSIACQMQQCTTTPKIEQCIAKKHLYQNDGLAQSCSVAENGIDRRTR